MRVPAPSRVVVEHIEWRAPHAAHDAFVAAFAEARALRLAARGCRSVEVTFRQSEEGEAIYRARIEWRSSEEQTAFAASEAAALVDGAMAAFARHAHHVDTHVGLSLGSGGPEMDAADLRRAFGHFPTGIAVVTAMGPEGPASIVVSSFTSVSLQPPLVSFCAAHTSTTWPVIADARSCCINVLAASQGELCRTLASKKDPRLSTIAWTPSPSGAPVLDGVACWLDCRVVEVRAAGDHDLVLLEVLAHGSKPDTEPLLFHRSGYRTLASP